MRCVNHLFYLKLLQTEKEPKADVLEELGRPVLPPGSWIGIYLPHPPCHLMETSTKSPETAYVENRPGERGNEAHGECLGK